PAAKTALLLLVALSLGGCINAAQYAAEPIAVPGQYGGDAHTPTQRIDITAADAATRWHAVAWWREFDAARLDRMVQQALAANNNLAAAGLALRAARLQAGLAGNKRWPSV